MLYDQTEKQRSCSFLDSKIVLLYYKFLLYTKPIFQHYFFQIALIKQLIISSSLCDAILYKQFLHLCKSLSGSLMCSIDLLHPVSILFFFFLITMPISQTLKTERLLFSTQNQLFDKLYYFMYILESSCNIPPKSWQRSA